MRTLRAKGNAVRGWVVAAGLALAGLSGCAPSDEQLCRASVNAAFNCALGGFGNRNSALEQCGAQASGRADPRYTGEGCQNSGEIRAAYWQCLGPVGGEEASLGLCGTFVECLTRLPACRR